MPGLFRKAGYQAHAVGKLHVYPQRDRIGFDEVILNEEGRHHLEGGNADDWELYLADQGYPGQEYASGLGNNDYLTRSWHLPEHCHPTNWAAAQMCRAIRRRDPRKPGFWYLSFVGPHPPLWPPAAYLDLYRNLELDPMVHGDWSRSFEDLPWSVKPYMDQFCMRMATPGEIDLARRGFYATITHIDHQIRMVLGTLREEGLSEDTIVAFTADHGDMLGDHRMWSMGVMYEKSVRVPLIIVPAAGDGRFPPGSQDHRLAELRDLMPTLLDLCGLEPPAGLDGISLAGSQDRDHLYGEFREGPMATRMICDRRYKLILLSSRQRLPTVRSGAGPSGANESGRTGFPAGGSGSSGGAAGGPPVRLGPEVGPGGPSRGAAGPGIRPHGEPGPERPERLAVPLTWDSKDR